MDIDPETPSAGVPPLVRAGLSHNFAETREKLLEHIGRMDGMHTRIQALEVGQGGGLGQIVARIEALEGKASLHDDAIEGIHTRLERHRVRIRFIERLIHFFHGWGANDPQPRQRPINPNP